MTLSKTILILEDHLLTLSKLFERLEILEQDQPFSISTIVLTEYRHVEQLINNNPDVEIDIVLLDGDCKGNRTFHVFDIERFGADKVIAISSVPRYNEEARKRGVKRVILKDFRHLDEFAEKVVGEIAEILRKMPLVE